MVKYAREPEEATKSCKARGSDLRTHFKNMRETAGAIKKMELSTAKKFLEDVIAMRRCVVFRRFCGGVGRTAQAKNEGSTNDQGRWPKKSAEFLLGLLKNAESNAEVRVVLGFILAIATARHWVYRNTAWRCTLSSVVAVRFSSRDVTRSVSRLGCSRLVQRIYSLKSRTDRRPCNSFNPITGEGFGCGFSFGVPHSGEQSDPAAPPNVPRPRSHQPLHVLPVPRRAHFV